MDNLDEKRISHFNSTAEEWRSRSFDAEGAKRLEWIFSFGAIKPGHVVLDLGCGTGRLTPHLLALIGERGKVVGVDFAENMTRIAREKYPQADFFTAAADRLPFSEASFDAAIMFHSLPHFGDKLAALREAFRVIKSGGTLIIAHTTGREKMHQIHASIGLKEDLLPEPKELKLLLTTAGFNSILQEEREDRFYAQGKK